jgi:uncharacterized protein YggU (UPF0235/DUF167 family)
MGGCLAIRLMPNSFKDEFKGISEGSQGRLYLKATVRAVLENGLANNALLKLISKRWGITKDSLTLQNGTTRRLKILKIEKKALLAFETIVMMRLRAYSSLKNI